MQGPTKFTYRGLVLKSLKRRWRFDCLFALLGSAGLKAVHRMLMKLTQGLSRSSKRAPGSKDKDGQE